MTEPENHCKFKLYCLDIESRMISRFVYASIVAAALLASVMAVPAYAQTPVSQTKPILKDSLGRNLDEGNAESIVILSTTVENNTSNAVPFIALMEVRDWEGSTVYIQFQLGELPSKGESELGISWTPATAGQYELRTFLISSFVDPVEILTPVQQNIITIN